MRTAPAEHDEFGTSISGAVSRRWAADAMRRRSFYPAASGCGRKARTRQLRFVNPDPCRGVRRRDLARRWFGAERGLQLSDRGLEARDVSAVAGAGDGAAATAQDC